jgi:hypothetical protein
MYKIWAMEIEIEKSWLSLLTAESASHEILQGSGEMIRGNPSPTLLEGEPPPEVRERQVGIIVALSL